MRKLGEGGEGAGRSGSTAGAWLEALMSCVVFFSPSRETMTKLRGCVCSRYSHPCFLLKKNVFKLL